MNTAIRRAAIACLVLFVALMVNANFLQVGKAKTLRDKPDNRRTLLANYDHKRGDIVAADGTTIAKSVPTDDELKYLRVYPDGPMYAPITGIYSIVYGTGVPGLEGAENDFLSGDDDRLFVKHLVNLISGRTNQGGSVVTTIEPAVQKAAYDALKGVRGAAVAIDPRTGAILALVSTPSYDPSTLTTHNTAAIKAAWQKLTADPANPMLDRAINQTYPPGSSFKTITAATALSHGYTPDTSIPAPSVLPYPNSTKSLKNYAGEQCGNGQTATLRQALVISCNTAFGALGDALDLNYGSGTLRGMAQAFGFNSRFTIPMTSARSVFPSDLDRAQTIQSAIGQFNVRATPLQMAMVAATIANHGVMMAPYLVDRLVAPDLSVVDRTQPKELREVISSQVADQLTSMMIDVVNKGTGTAARMAGVQVAGKTGTAQNAEGEAPHTWFIAFAPAENPQVAVAVLVEHGGGSNDATGGRVSAPIAKAIIQAALQEAK